MRRNTRYDGAPHLRFPAYRPEAMRHLMDRLAFHQGRLVPRLRFTRSLWGPDFEQDVWTGPGHTITTRERLTVQAIQRKTARPGFNRRAA